MLTSGINIPESLHVFFVKQLLLTQLNLLSANPHKTVKNTQTILQQFVDCLSVFGHFVGLAFKGLIHYS